MTIIIRNNKYFDTLSLHYFVSEIDFRVVNKIDIHLKCLNCEVTVLSNKIFTQKAIKSIDLTGNRIIIPQNKHAIRNLDTLIKFIGDSVLSNYERRLKSLRPFFITKDSPNDMDLLNEYIRDKKIIF